MRKTPALVLFTATIWLGFACSGDDAGPGPASNSASGSAGAPLNTSGAAGSLSSSGAGGAQAGAGGSGGTAALAGGAGGGQAGSAQGGGSGGASGAGGAGGSGGGNSAAKPSTGCTGGGGRPSGGVVTTQGHYFTFPESYDGTKPFPVLVGFHGCGGVNRGNSLDDTEWIRLTDGTAFETEYVRVVPLSADTGGCWNYNTDITRVKAMYDDLLADHCIDTSRVFATGHSSGAQFIVQIYGQNRSADAKHLGFKAVAPVAASDYGVMAGPIPVMYIQGKMDAERNNGDGHETVERFRAANGCGSSSKPYSSVAGCQSMGTAVNPGCIVYDTCQAPTIWCSHNDPQYGNTMHGVPCFGVKAMYDFFKSLP